ncbi:BhsG: hydroxybenzylsuccinyl-CoA dehydrogenase [Desulfobacula toluolica Tol2]|uniref:Medium-chain specific acyl-CoA dehydrogenase, mitochondrial n=3 Tax=Desulfobacteraceae TaxID=213119 RepID=K0N3H1_DESTT|nr:BhsG: hydroxybenzylsuccinyl-CoA dehydrogenase [Desulfobacula toluolica Tol2]SDT88399.1 (R)-benzylsuccinyl-CoA dehydrogenase [Desulfobacula phenolica]
MDFSISEEYMMLKEAMREFVKRELLPLEKTLLERDMSLWTEPGPLIPKEDSERLYAITKELGFWGIEVEEKFGGQGLGMLAKTLVMEEMCKSFVGFSPHGFMLPPDAPNLYYLDACCVDDQRETYFIPYCNRELDSAMAVTEPDAGSDVSGLKTTAVRKGDKWVLNGTKTFISKCDKDNVFFILIAVTDKEASTKDKFTAFLIDKSMPGVRVGKEIPVIGAMPTWELILDDVEVGDNKVLGEVGKAFIPLQNRFGVRRIELASRCTGMAERLIQMMIDQANTRITFGKPLADRQTVQNWIADSTMELEAVRLRLYYACWKNDQGLTDLRIEGSNIKVAATEMLSNVADRAMQMHGGVGLSKELGIEYVARMVRIWRVLEGPNEIHRWTIARAILRDKKPYNPFIVSAEED